MAPSFLGDSAQGSKQTTPALAEATNSTNNLLVFLLASSKVPLHYLPSALTPEKEKESVAGVVSCLKDCI